jgi:hypothetical protein
MTTYDIPLQLAAAAHHLAPFFTPHNRKSGFTEEGSKTARGRGDYTDLIASLTIFSMLAEADIVCRLELTAGAGDSSDLAIRYRGNWQTVNIKSSTYRPYSDRLNLFIKEEEINKGIDIYVQVFVHLDENDEAAHIHVPGWLARGGQSWREHTKTLIEIPGTGGHKGAAIPVSILRPLTSLIEIADHKF